MKNSTETPSPSSNKSSKSLFKDPIEPTSKTPYKPPPQRTRNRRFAFSISDIRKVVKRLQDRKQTTNETKSLKHPEKYDYLGKFFDGLDSSIRLLQLTQLTASFTNIRPKIENLTHRRFTHSHLAQLKFILPEAIEITKILVLDEQTSFMKPDLHVTIYPGGVEFDAKLLSESGTMSLRKLFRERLKDFWKSHPEGDEIPEEILPEPFRPKINPFLHILPSSVYKVTLSETCYNPPTRLSTVPAETSVEALNQMPAVASHISPSFRRWFSRKLNENVHPKFPSDSLQPLAVPISESSLKISSTDEVAKSHQKPSPSELVSEVSSSEACPTINSSSECFMPANVTAATPNKPVEHTESKDSSISTPARLLSTPYRLMTATPTLKPLKRNFMSPGDISTYSPDKLVKRPPRSRSLKFDTPMKNENE